MCQVTLLTIEGIEMEEVTYISLLQSYDETIADLTREESETAEKIRIIRSTSPQLTSKELALTEHLTMIRQAKHGYLKEKTKMVVRCHKQLNSELMARRLKLRHVPMMATKWGVHNA